MPQVFQLAAVGCIIKTTRTW